MKLRFAPATFMIAFCCVYALVFWNNWPLFLYYPLHGDFTWGPAVLKGAGPGMAWYGFMVDAGVSAFVLSVLISDRLSAGIFRNYLWVFPCAAMLICVYLVRHFFTVI
jgi:hypothetical protein